MNCCDDLGTWSGGEVSRMSHDWPYKPQHIVCRIALAVPFRGKKPPKAQNVGLRLLPPCSAESRWFV